MVEAIDAVLISNLLVTIGLFIATLYRIILEKHQVNWFIKRMKEEDTIIAIKKVLKLMETEKCDDMTVKDFKDILEAMVKEYENFS